MNINYITLVTRDPVNLNMPKYGAIPRTVILIAYKLASSRRSACNDFNLDNSEFGVPPRLIFLLMAEVESIVNC